MRSRGTRLGSARAASDSRHSSASASVVLSGEFRRRAKSSARDRDNRRLDADLQAAIQPPHQQQKEHQQQRGEEKGEEETQQKDHQQQQLLEAQTRDVEPSEHVVQSEKKEAAATANAESEQPAGRDSGSHASGATNKTAGEVVEEDAVEKNEKPSEATPTPGQIDTNEQLGSVVGDLPLPPRVPGSAPLPPAALQGRPKQKRSWRDFVRQAVMQNSAAANDGLSTMTETLPWSAPCPLLLFSLPLLNLVGCFYFFVCDQKSIKKQKQVCVSVCLCLCVSVCAWVSVCECVGAKRAAQC